LTRGLTRNDAWGAACAEKRERSAYAISNLDGRQRSVRSTRCGHSRWASFNFRRMALYWWRDGVARNSPWRIVVASLAVLAEVVLVVAGAVREICPEVFGLNRANREVFGDFKINASARAHSEGVLGRVDDGPASAEQAVGKWRELAVWAKINSRPEQVGENSRAEASAGVVAAELTDYLEPMIDVVTQLAAASIEVEGSAAGVHAKIVVADVQVRL
jgi:hypothetical protein